MGGDKTQHRKDSAFATECCHKYVRRSIKVNKGSLSKEDVIMALLFDLLNDAVGEFCDAEFDNETLPFIEKFIGMVTFIEVLRTHYLMDLNKILKGIDSAIYSTLFTPSGPTIVGFFVCGMMPRFGYD